ncbi:MAG: N-acetyltransferase family protein [Pseudomonadota bacterium]
MIRKACKQDTGQLAAIYNHYVVNTIVTFDLDPVTTEWMDNRIDDVTARHPFLVCEKDGRIVGYAYAAKWSEKRGYAHTAEITIYVAPHSVGKGHGSQLLSALLNQLREMGMRCLLAGIALPNPSSIALHEKFGFQKTARFPDIGVKFDKPVDVGYWRLQLQTDD